MTTQSAPLLTANDADLLLRGFDPYGALDTTEALQALADGRTVNVRVMSEDECRAEFEAWAADASHDGFVSWPSWFACARAMGAIR